MTADRSKETSNGAGTSRAQNVGPSPANRGSEAASVAPDQSQPSSRRPRRRILFAILGLLGLVLLVWGVRFLLYARVHESTDDAYVGGHLVPVLAKVGGYVEQVRVVENQHVQEGDVLVSLDATELQHRLSGAEAELDAARSAVSGEGSTGRANAMVEQAQRRQAAVEAQLQAARARSELAETDFSRMDRLAEREIVSQQRLDAARAEATTSRAAVEALEAEAAAARASVVDAEGGLRQAQSRIEALESTVAQARLDLSRARIVAPTSGLVAKRSVEPGQLVQPGQGVLTVVADTGVYVTANFKETQIAEIHVGASVELDVDAYSGCVAGGEVESLGGATGSQFSLLPADNATGNFTKVVQRIPVRIRVLEGCGSGRPLRPGMSVVTHVSTGGGEA